jgi:ABC-type branched-subunit amino acid transport system substrate-binding protein
MKRGHAGLVVLAAGVLALSGFAAGCGDDESSAAGGDVPAELKMGVLVPLTGALKDFGGPNQKAAFLGRDQVNAAATAAGLTFKISTTAADTGTDPKKAQVAATKVIDGDKSTCVVGPMASSEVVAVAQNVSTDAGVPIISPSSTAPSVRADVPADGLVYRTPPPDTLQGPVLAAEVFKDVGAGGSVVVAAQNDAYGTSLAQTFVDAYTAAGGTIGGETILFDPAAASFDSDAGKIVASNPAAFVIVTFPETFAKLAPALVRTGKWDPAKTWGTDGIRSTDLPTTVGKEGTEGIRGTVATDKGNPLASKFNDLWTAQGLGKRQTYDAQMFDAAVLCGLGAIGAKSTEGTAIADQIQKISGPPGDQYTFEQIADAMKAVAAGDDIDYQGASGPIDLGDDGDPAAGSYVVWSYTGGKLVDGEAVIEAGQ